jgi:predicted AlkP superfamily phosphohydrolase/phosphomutase
MFQLKKKKRPRVCVIGLDGVPHGMIADLAGRGVMPAMAGLVTTGRLHRMKASLPEISAVSWSNFMTGRNSGTHGIFGFTDFKPGTYDVRFPNSLDLQAPAVWETLGARGLRSVVINQPSTYPARPMNGVLIAGFVAIELAKAVHPLSYRAALDRIGYRVDIDTVKSREDHDFLWRELNATMDAHEKALDLLWGEPWDYFEFVVTGTDRLHHFLWDAYGDEAHPFHGRFLDYYRRVDRVIDRLVTSYRKDGGSDRGLYLLSDHGFTGIVQEVHLNSWLEQTGYLKFPDANRRGLEDVAPGTSAFALDPNRIYLNLKGRFPRGDVEAADRESVREAIAGALTGLTFEGRRVVRKVFRSEEVYSGPLMRKGPDLIVLGEPGFDMKGSVKKQEVFGRTSLRGMHTWDDAFFWSKDDHGPDLAIEDIAGLILGHYS